MPTTEPTYGWPLPVTADPPDGPGQIAALAAGIATTLGMLYPVTVVEVDTAGYQSTFENVSDGARYRYNGLLVELAFRFRKSSTHTKNNTYAVFQLPASLAPKGGRATVGIAAQSGGGSEAPDMGGYVEGTTDTNPGLFSLYVSNGTGAFNSDTWIRAGGSWLRDPTVTLP